MGKSTFWRISTDDEIQGLFKTCDGIILDSNAVIITYSGEKNPLPVLYWVGEEEEEEEEEKEEEGGEGETYINTARQDFKLGFQSFCYNGYPIYSAFHKNQIHDFLPPVLKDWEYSVHGPKKTSENLDGKLVYNNQEIDIKQRKRSNLISPENPTFNSKHLIKKSTDLSFDKHTMSILNMHSFKYSIYPILYSITTSLIVVLVLTLVVFIKPRGRQTKSSTRLLLYLGTILASINLLRLIIMIFKMFQKQHRVLGASSSNEVLAYILNDSFFNVVQYLAEFMCYLVQLQNIMRLYHRITEKRLTFCIGLTLLIIYEALWGVCTFINEGGLTIEENTRLENSLGLLSAVVYLIRISIGTCYALIIIINVIVNRQLCFHNNNGMFLMTTLAVVSVCLQPCLFIVDIANFWVEHLSMVFNPTCSVASAVVIWDWIDRLQFLQKAKQAQSILGRPVYMENELDEPRHMVKYGLKLLNVLKKLEKDEDDKNGFDNGQEFSNNKNIILAGELSNPDMEQDQLSFNHSQIEDSEDELYAMDDIQLQDSRSTSTHSDDPHISLVQKIFNKCSYALDSLVEFGDNYIINTLAQKSSISSSFSESNSNIITNASNNKKKIYNMKRKKKHNLGTLTENHYSNDYMHNENYDKRKIGTELHNANNKNERVYIYSTKEADFDE